MTDLVKVQDGEGTKEKLESLVGWLRDCAVRLARENSRDLRPVHGQLKIINATAREILALRLKAAILPANLSKVEAVDQRFL